LAFPNAFEGTGPDYASQLVAKSIAESVYQPGGKDHAFADPDRICGSKSVARRQRECLTRSGGNVESYANTDSDSLPGVFGTDIDSFISGISI
jgi:hypothetical protein